MAARCCFTVGFEKLLAELLDVGCDHDRVDPSEVLDAAVVEPVAEEPDGSSVSGAGVLVPDVRGEELEEAPRRPVAGLADDRRDARGVGVGEPLRLLDDGEFPRLRHVDFRLLRTAHFRPPYRTFPGGFAYHNVLYDA